MSFLKDFREFISRGNVIDLAVGVVIGAAFGKIVDSLVKDLIMPPIGFLIGRVDFTNLKVNMGHDVTINYGNFIQTLVQFVIVAFSIFLMIKAVKWFKEQGEKDNKPNETPLPTNEEKLLTEIRDILKSQSR